jgi:hypothetical protein
VATRLTPSPLVAALLEHLVSSCMHQLNEIRSAVGVPLDMPHTELIAHLKTLVSQPEG